MIPSWNFTSFAGAGDEDEKSLLLKKSLSHPAIYDHLTLFCLWPYFGGLLSHDLIPTPDL
jgi:hypothetical protein